MDLNFISAFRISWEKWLYLVSETSGAKYESRTTAFPESPCTFVYRQSFTLGSGINDRSKGFRVHLVEQAVVSNTVILCNPYIQRNVLAFQRASRVWPVFVFLAQRAGSDSSIIKSSDIALAAHRAESRDISILRLFLRDNLIKWVRCPSVRP